MVKWQIALLFYRVDNEWKFGESRCRCQRLQLQGKQCWTGLDQVRWILTLVSPDIKNTGISVTRLTVCSKRMALWILSALRSSLPCLSIFLVGSDSVKQVRHLSVPINPIIWLLPSGKGEMPCHTAHERPVACAQQAGASAHARNAWSCYPISFLPSRFIWTRTSLLKVSVCSRWEPSHQCQIKMERWLKTD